MGNNNYIPKLPTIQEREVNNTRPVNYLLFFTKTTQVNADDNSAESENKFAKIQSNISNEYKNFATVISKTESELLPEHQKYDIGINAEENKTILFGPIFPLSEPESKALKLYLDENMKKGYIRSLNSPAGAPIFFVKQKNWVN